MEEEARQDEGPVAEVGHPGRRRREFHFAKKEARKHNECLRSE